MMTQAKLDANRANAQKSTGPISPEGKTNSSRNSFKHGLYSKQLVVGAEEAAELDALKTKLRAEHQPINETEEILVNELAERWRLRRSRIYEASMLDSGEVLIPHLNLVQRMMSSAERGFHKALAALRQLQKDRGFVPQEQNRDCEGAAGLTADGCSLSTGSGSRSESASALGFVPPPCPEDEQIDPADWARAFKTRHELHNRIAEPRA
ncbi:MAG TPA: hypothetical protein VFB14_07115 [Bryobacteraceae bacterium]|jgi:hypothetical protein|nr:hypothetical protein [Bryobacteraceae bacterium]